MYIFLQIASNHINSDRPQAVVGQICKFPHSRKKSPAKPDMVLLNNTRSSVDRSKTRCNIAKKNFLRLFNEATSGFAKLFKPRHILITLLPIA